MSPHSSITPHILHHPAELCSWAEGIGLGNAEDLTSVCVVPVGRPAKVEKRRGCVVTPSPITIDGDRAIIHLTDGSEAIIDAADVPLVSAHRWHRRKNRKERTCYAFANITSGPCRQTTAFLHRLILDPPAGKLVDHINGDGLNNRRSNLRIVTCGENLRNRRKRRSGKSGRFLGVSWDAKREAWRADICVDGRRIYIGRFSDEIEAAKARDVFAIKHHGDFANLNFPTALMNAPISKAGALSCVEGNFPP